MSPIPSREDPDSSRRNDLISIEGLGVRFFTRSECIHAVDTVDLCIAEGDHVGLIGESGCGKTVMGMAVMGLLPENARIDGSIRYRGLDLLRAETGSMQKIRGREIAMIMQNSANSLNPVVPVGNQVAEPLRVHRILSREAAYREAIRLLGAMGFPEPEQAAASYPHEISGGMRERVLVAMALACQPDVVIADEPTTGLDTEIKTQILHLIKNQMTDRTLLLITHDLGTAHFLCSRIVVMYSGEIVEEGPADNLLSQPLHPYTQGLIFSLPSAGLHPIPGVSPSPAHLPEGCRFSPRCPSATARCSRDHPQITAHGSRRVRCFRYD